MPPRYKLILWDLDDTLFDFESAQTNAITRLFGEYEIPCNGAEDLARFHRINSQWWKKYEQGEVEKNELMLRRWQELFNHRAMDYQKFNDTYLEYLGSMKKPYPEAVEVVRQLDALGCIQAIVTNGAKVSQDLSVWPSAIAPYIKTMVISDEAGIAKPDQRIFALACEKAGWHDKATTLMVGDSPSSDIAGGQAYGIDTCYYNPNRKGTSLGPSYTIDALSQVLDIIASR